MNRRLLAALLMLALGMGSAARAAVAVLANRTADAIQFTIASDAEKARDCTIRRGEALSIPAAKNLRMDYRTRDVRRRIRLQPNEIYFFLPAPKGVEVRQLGFTGVWGRPAKAGGNEEATLPQPAAKRFPLKVPVKILVDQTEPTVRKAWEKRLRARIEAASDIVERYCRVRFEVVAASTWESDAGATTVAKLLRDFESKASPGSARLAIGFTGRVAPKDGDKALGGTHGPLYSHMIIREWKLRTDAERLEVLVHELGHFLGACHSPEGDSVMRPKLGDGLVNRRGFRIGYDAINTLVLNIVAEEMARKPVRKLTELSADSQKQLMRIYATVARADADDPAAPHYIRLMGGTPPEPMPTKALPPDVVNGARAVVAAVTKAATENDQLPPPRGAVVEGRRRSGDALTALYCRAAAEACQHLSPDHARTAYLLGLAIAVDREPTLRSLYLAKIPWNQIESDVEHGRRIRVLGEPTMFGQRTLLQHFLVSAALLVVVEGKSISAAGIQEELLLVQGGNEFRFDDFSAGLAGTLFATQLDSSPGLLDELVKSFRVADFLLDPKTVSEPLSREEFAREYGSITDERFLRQQDILRKRLLALPGYQPRLPRSEN